MKLKLTPGSRKSPEQRTDDEGTVVVKIWLASGNIPKKNNITKTIRVTGKVSEVHAAIMEMCEYTD